MRFFTQNIILENFNISNSSIDELNEIKKEIIDNISKEVDISKKILDSFNVKEKLNPALWNNETLKPNVKNKLIEIGKDFFKSLELPEEIKLKDILFLGSLANYNWSEFSDIDLHIVIDFDKFKDDKDFIKKHFDNERNLWNDKYNVKIKSYPVEVYVQDIKEKVASSSVYSVPNNKWIVKPERQKIKIDKNEIKRKAKRIIDKLEDIKIAYENNNFDNVINKVNKLKNSIKRMRKISLDKEGEFSLENLIFKVLRRTNFVEILDSYKVKAYDKKHSLNQ